MPWHTPFTQVMGAVITAVRLNETRDNLRYLKGLDGAVVVENALEVEGDLDITGGEVRIDGVVVGAGITDFQRFTSSGTWNKPDGAQWVLVEVIGGGAGGSAARNDAEGLISGGPPGQVVHHLFRATDLSATETVTVGAGGASVSTSDITANRFSTGGDGGTSSFGDLNALGGTYQARFTNSTVAISANNSGTLAHYLLRVPGTGAISGAAFNDMLTTLIRGDTRAVPGRGLTAITADETDGADNPDGTGSGGGRSQSSNADAGDGGAPGGGGGALAEGNSGYSSGAGGRGEVRVWSW